MTNLSWLRLCRWIYKTLLSYIKQVAAERDGPVYLLLAWASVWFWGEQCRLWACVVIVFLRDSASIPICTNIVSIKQHGRETKSRQNILLISYSSEHNFMGCPTKKPLQCSHLHLTWHLCPCYCHRFHHRQPRNRETFAITIRVIASRVWHVVMLYVVGRGCI